MVGLPAALALALPVLAFSFSLARAAHSDGGSTRAARQFRTLSSLTEQCKFTLEGQAFDLCPILDGNDRGWTLETERRTPPTITKTSYSINLRGPLEKNENAPPHEQCPPGTWICQIVSNRRPLHNDEEPRVLQTVPVAGAMNLPNITRYHPGVNITAQLAPPRQEAHHDVLHIRLHGGFYVYGPQKADLQFICDHDVDEPTKPSVGWNWNGTHTFFWRTKHACGKQLSPGRATMTATHIPAPTKAPADEDMPPVDGELPGDHLADGHPLDRSLSHARLALVLSSFTAVLVLAYLAWFPPARVRQAVSRFVKAHPRLARFRVGERVLMRWAYEDLEMEDGDGYAEGEEDVMVNFAPEADPEGIPLKPSPRQRAYAGYGTT